MKKPSKAIPSEGFQWTLRDYSSLLTKSQNVKVAATQRFYFPHSLIKINFYATAENKNCVAHNFYIYLWTRRDSNPRPNKELKSFLRA